jgi:hypothetical protein
MKRAWPFRLALALAASVASFAHASDEDVWVKDAKEAARHVQSGFACPKELLTDTDVPPAHDLPTVLLQTVIVASDTANRGDHVACEYEGRDGGWATVEIGRLNGPEDTVANHEGDARERVKKRFPNVLRDAELPGLPPTITSPSGGRTYLHAYYNAGTSEEPAAVSIAGGDVGNWMITLIQFDHTKSATGLKLATGVNWQRVANSRTK